MFNVEHQWIRLNKLYKLMEKLFRINGRKPKNIQTNSEAWILIKLQCVICHWILLNERYKQMESFFRISFELMAENQKIFKQMRGVNIDQSAMCYLSMNLARQTLQTNEKLKQIIFHYYLSLIW